MFIWNLNLIPWHKSFLLDFCRVLPLFHTYRGWWPQALVLPEGTCSLRGCPGVWITVLHRCIFLDVLKGICRTDNKAMLYLLWIVLEAFSYHSVTQTGLRCIKQHSKGSTCQGRCCSSHWHQLTRRSLTVHQGLH